MVVPLTDHIDRAKGALLGLAVGDALGAPVEFKPRGSFPPVTGMMAGGPHGLPAGAWTDDTAMALCLAKSLLAKGRYDPIDFLDRLCLWAETGENSSTGRAIGIGQYTLFRLGEYRRTGNYPAPGNLNGRSDGNGALVRVAPAGIWQWKNIPEAGHIGLAQSRSTHASEYSKWACNFTARLIAALIQGLPWEEAIREGCELLHDWDYMMERIEKRHEATEPPSTGFVLDTLQAALWAVEQSQSFEEAVLKAVNLGGDADSVGAVAGQIAGARYGVGGIPEAWLGLLAKREEIEKVAVELGLKR